MWCLISFHWGVCHYFISRAIWWASVSCWKSACLRGEQWVHWQRGVKTLCAPGSWWRREGTRLSETEWEICGAAPAEATLHFHSWFTVLMCRKDRRAWIVIWIGMWKACLSPGSSVFPSVFCEAGTQGRGFCCYPAGGTVCVLSTIHWESALFVRQCLLHLQLSWKDFVRELVDGDYRWWWSGGKTTSDAVTSLDMLLLNFPFLDVHTVSTLAWAVEVCSYVGNMSFWVAILPCVVFPLCAFLNNALNACEKKSMGKGGRGQYPINTSPDATVKHINRVSPTVVFIPQCALTALCPPAGLLKITLPTSSILSLHMWTFLEEWQPGCAIVTIELAIGVVIAHRHVS